MSRRRKIDVLLIVLAAVVAFAPAVFGEFVYDDLHSVRDNQALWSLANLPSLLWDVDAFSSIQARMYRPVLLVSFSIDHAIGTGAPWAFKLTDVLVHACTALLVASLVRSLRGGRGPALLAGLLFAVHPLASEAINMVSSRSDQMLALGALLAMRCHVGAMAGHRRAILGTALATALACGCKETGVVIPALLVVLEGLRWLRGRAPDVRGAALRIAPAAAVVTGYLVLRRLLLGVTTVAAPRLTESTDVTSGGGRDLMTQLDAMGQVLPKFLAQSVVPFGLTIDPVVPLEPGWSVFGVCGWVAVVALTVLGLRAPRRRPLAFAGTCLAWSAALPWVLIPLNAPAGEHRVYASLAGLCVCAAAILPRDVLRRRAVRVAAPAALCVLAAMSAVRSAAYSDPESLWRETLASNPLSASAMRSLADAHRERALAAMVGGDADLAEREVGRAIELLDRALVVQPRHVPTRKAAIRMRLGLGEGRWRPLTALVYAESLLVRGPDDPLVRILVAQCQIAVGRMTGGPRFLADAERMALSCLDVAEPKGLVFRVAAEARSAMGDEEGALAHLDDSIGRGLDHVSVRVDRAAVLVRLDRTGEAREEIARVLREDPFEPAARRLLAEITAAPPGR